MSLSKEEEEALEKALGAFDEVDEDLVEEEEDDEEAPEDAAAEDDAEAAEDADDASAADDGVVDEDALLPEDDRAIDAFVGDDGDDDVSVASDSSAALARAARRFLGKGEPDEADGAAAPAPAPGGGTRPLTEEEKREKKLGRIQLEITPLAVEDEVPAPPDAPSLAGPRDEDDADQPSGSAAAGVTVSQSVASPTTLQSILQSCSPARMME